jgi:hypothetical protein
MYGELNRQASMLAFNDAFHLAGLFFVGALLLVFLIRKGEPNAGPVDTH